MKLLLLIALLSLCAAAHADFVKNPDRTLSLGFDITGARLDNAIPGLQLYDPARGQNLVTPSTQPITQRFLTADIRTPVSESITIDMHGGSWNQSTPQGSSTGYTIGGGMRYYFVNW